MMSEPVSNILRPNIHIEGVSLDACSEGEILSEQAFLRMLCLERKRAERSSRRFVLMLLESSNLLSVDSDAQVLGKIMRVLMDSTRETDIKGWHKEGSIIGVIFTEIGDTEGRTVAKVLLDRITPVLYSTLDIDDINAIKISFYVFPAESGKHTLSNVANSPLYPDLIQDLKKRRVSRFLKRSIDIIGSLFALLLFFPLFIAITAAVKFSSKGPVLFRQERVGQFGQKFTFLKFRSMYFVSDDDIHKEYVKRLISGTADTDQGEGGRKLYKLRNDPRVTPVGRFLRRTSLDELPQLFNVLFGEMSLVGPRPPIPYELDLYSLWQTRRLLTVKPGITGLWQVAGRSTVTFDEMVRMDLQYAKTWSLWLDIKILLRTPGAMFSGAC